jgi:hypothetical protein
MENSYLIAFNKTRGIALALRAVNAETWDSRMRGLLGRTGMDQDEALWLAPCSQIHMFFMKFAIDAIFLDKNRRVLRIFENLKPWRITPWVWRAHGVLEMTAGASIGKVAVGDQIEFKTGS